MKFWENKHEEKIKEITEAIILFNENLKTQIGFFDVVVL